MDKSLASPLNEVTLEAIKTMQAAMDEGKWEPAPEHDPAELIEALKAAASSQPSVIDLAQARDLVGRALEAMEVAEWTSVTEAEVSIIQRMNFLSSLADEMAPTPAEIAFAI
jgi:hypothetical protein